MGGGDLWEFLAVLNEGAHGDVVGVEGCGLLVAEAEECEEATGGGEGEDVGC